MIPCKERGEGVCYNFYVVFLENVEILKVGTKSEKKRTHDRHFNGSFRSWKIYTTTCCESITQGQRFYWWICAQYYLDIWDENLLYICLILDSLFTYVFITEHKQTFGPTCALLIFFLRNGPAFCLGISLHVYLLTWVLCLFIVLLQVAPSPQTHTTNKSFKARITSLFIEAGITYIALHLHFSTHKRNMPSLLYFRSILLCFCQKHAYLCIWSWDPPSS